ncbi:MAG TPA: hypothetical protein PLQ29_11045 [Spirochaetales bacterium]|nr:hypothetical protein [Spirochaetales bacterium]
MKKKAVPNAATTQPSVARASGLSAPGMPSLTASSNRYGKARAVATSIKGR